MADAVHHMTDTQVKILQREVLLAFYKVHILHHAGEEPLLGNWMLRELRRHGYDVSPGTLYPLLHRMERAGWLQGNSDEQGGTRAPRHYVLTKEGHAALQQIRTALRELYDEIGDGAPAKKPRKGAAR